MKKLIISGFLVASSLQAQPMLSHLSEYDKTVCLECLENSKDVELWDVFPKGQAELFFITDFPWIAKETWWQNATNILEIGSGNGTYLSKLADQSPDKKFLGIEILPLSIQQSTEHYAREGLIFKEGDAEIFNDSLCSSFDVILFRLTLQYLKNPLAALNNAWHYLSDGGHILIIDSCDTAAKSSHPIKSLQEALRMVSEIQLKNKKANRKATLDLLKILEEERSSLSELYEVVFSNVDTAGNVIHESGRFSTELERKLYFNHSLLFITLLHRTYQIPIDLSHTYDELKGYLEDEEAWNSPGMHFLVLRKKG